MLIQEAMFIFFCQMFQGLRLFKGVRLFRTLEYKLGDRKLKFDWLDFINKQPKF